MHRFVTVIGGAAPGPPMSPTSDPNCVVLDVAFLAFHRRRRVSCATINDLSGGFRELNPPPRSFRSTAPSELRIHSQRQARKSLRGLDDTLRHLVRAGRNACHGARARATILLLQPGRLGQTSSLRPIPRCKREPAHRNDVDDGKWDRRGNRRSRDGSSD